MPPPSRAELWSAGRDETVEVNQRALIDKILARYSGEHTIFRELLQNADDAGAQHVQVKFYTRAGIDAQEAGRPPATLPDVKRDAIHRYVVCNDGIPFRGEDWHRLKKIAEGNPDEEKIGAFGVGFYSLWSVCDDPFVESGDKWMGFYWKDGKDQLLARSGDLPPGSSASATAEPTSTGNPWTTFTMALREPTPLEGPLDFARFLVTSLTFMRTIKRVDMVVDDIKVLEVRKDIKGKTGVSRPGLNTTSTNAMMRVASVDATTMVITARVMKWLSATGVTPPPIPPPSAKTAARGLLASFFGRSTPVHDPTPPPPPTPPEDPTEVDVLAREIQTFQADIKVSISSQFGRELERATKKAPPSRMPASLVFSREDESVTVNGTPTEKKAGVVFSGLCPPLDGEKSARVFIGQPTSQTTGIGGHLAARFIPTVERESIDLVDRHVAQWNRELLWVGGYLARLIYELELYELQQQWNKTSTADQATRAQILARALHALKFFSFRPTTPSAAVGSEMESAFFSCARNNSNLPLLSTAGILTVGQVRIPHEELQLFLPELPVLTPATVTDAPRAVARLRERSLLRDIAFDDVVKQLGQRPLTEKEMVHCLAWWQSIATVEGYNPQVRARLLDAAIVVTDNSKVVPLGVIRSYVNPQSTSIPTDMPLPPDTLPYSVTKGLKGTQIHSIFGWTELSLAHYVTYLATPPMSGNNGADPDTDLRVSPAFSERVLTMLGRGWQSVSAHQQTAIADALKEVPCIPTRAGFKKPSEAYFENNLLFDDLPVIAFPKTAAIRGGLEKMLLGIGVRRTVDLQLIFSRLIGGGTWGCFELMKYLVSVKDTLSNEEIARLRQTAAFPLEQAPLEDGTKPQVVRQKPNQLYEPTEAMRNLGLPVLDWGEAKWKSNSDEAKMMFELGLRKFPPVDVLLGIIAGRPPMNERALAYLLANIHTNYPSFEPSAYRDVAFIPATGADGKEIFGKPGQVFTNQACSILGFAVARPPVSAIENAAKLRLATDPPMEQLVAALINNPLHDLDKAKAVFEYLASRVGTAQVAALAPLSVRPFIPVKEEKNLRLARPDEVYFTSKTGVEPLYASAFTFIDFGDRANLFLRQCGVMAEPSHKDIARLLLRDPERMLRQAGSSSKYKEQLRLLAANWSTFDSRLIAEMKNTAFLLGSQRVTKKAAKEKGHFEDDNYATEWALCKASDAVIVDDAVLLQYFGKDVLAVPEEQLLERFYGQLGSQPLSSRVNTESIPSGIKPGSSRTTASAHRHVLERLTIYLAQATRKETDYTADWLSKGDNFVVQEAADIKARFTYRHGRVIREHVETKYAMATRVPRSKAIVLTLSMSTPADYYDVAACLCQVLLKKVRADDILILDSILSTPLMALRKRGFNVDRILNQQNEERLRLKAEAAKDREAQVAAAAAAEKNARESSLAQANAAGVGQPNGAQSQAVAQRQVAPNGKPYDPEVGGGAAGGAGSLLEQMRKWRGSMPGALGGGTTPPAIRSAAEQVAQSYRGGPNGPGLPQMGGGSSTVTTARPTDPERIRNTVRHAVGASRPETGTQISDTKRRINDVSESQGHYCDESAEADLRLAVDPGPQGCKVFLEPGMTFTEEQQKVCQRFAQYILIPLGEVYELKPSVLNIFWDTNGPLIAFNRSGALFCNARYFSAWHDNDVVQGRLGEAFISWYFTLAHELAHNLESAHNASHEFYFSSISEEYFVRFAKLMQARTALLR